VKPRCYDCLSEDVAVRVIDDLGFEHWFCAEDWAAVQELHEKVMATLGDAAARLEELAP
jgi:prophage antirepressor-like protein